MANNTQSQSQSNFIAIWTAEENKRVPQSFNFGDAFLGAVLEYLIQDIGISYTHCESLYEPTLPQQLIEKLPSGIFTDHFQVKEGSNYFYYPADGKGSDFWTLLKPGTYCFAPFQQVKLYHRELQPDFWYLPAGVYYIPPGSKVPAFFLREGYVKSNWTEPTERMWQIFSETVKRFLLETVPEIVHLVHQPKRKRQGADIGGQLHRPYYIGSKREPWMDNPYNLPQAWFVPLKADEYFFQPFEPYLAPQGLWTVADQDKLYQAFPKDPTQEICKGVYFFMGGMYIKQVSTKESKWYKIPTGLIILKDRTLRRPGRCPESS